MAYSARGLGGPIRRRKCFSDALTHGQRRASKRRSIFKCYGHNWGDALRINSHSYICARQALMVQVAHSKKRPTAPRHLIIQQHILRGHSNALISSVHLARDVLFTPLLWRFSVTSKFTCSSSKSQHTAASNFNKGKIN